MITIRKEQMDTFRRHRRQGFEDRAVARLQANGPDDSSVRAWVQSEIAGALAAGFRSESDLLRLLVALHGLRGEAADELRETLMDAELTPATRLALIEGRTGAK